MKALSDLLPVILFFIGYKLYDIYIATGIAIGATLLLIVYSKIAHGKVEKMLLINGLIISVLGGVTLLLHDKTYIMWKPTVLYWVGAIALFVANAFFKNNLIQKMLGQVLNPPAHIWQRLNWVWIIFLIALGFLNLYVAFNYSEDTWVNFKLFGVTSVMFIFMMVQVFLLKEYLIEPPKE